MYTAARELAAILGKEDYPCMGYDMSGFDFNIKDVVNMLRLTIRHKNARSFDVDCPFCGGKGKMNINTERDVYRCNVCDCSGGMLGLYANLYGISYAEANRQIREALNLGQYRNDYAKAAEPEPQIKNSELVPEMEIDHTYSRMLSLLTLSDKHRDDLLGRGLTMTQIEEQRYRSVPLFGIKKLVSRLQEEGCTVQGVPGFHLDEAGSWTIHFSAKNSGILIPIVSMEGRIQGFQIRLDHATDSQKYIWLSSVNYHLGVSSGSPVHVIGDLSSEIIYVTEGALKGTIAHYLSGDTFVCVAGVTQYRNLKPILEKLRANGASYVWEAYDMDKKMKITCDGNHKKCGECNLSVKPEICPHKERKRRNIQNGCQKLYDICRDLSLPVGRRLWDADDCLDWNGNIKGIDDLYYKEKLRRAT